MNEQKLTGFVEWPEGYVPKVMIGTPIYEGKEYCREAFVENVKKLTYPVEKFIVVDNSRTNDYMRKLRRSGVNAWHVPRGNNSRDGHTNSLNFIRNVFLESDCDFLMILESDLFPEPNIIERLLRHKRLVCGAAYNIGIKASRGPCIFIMNQEEGNPFLGTRRIAPHEFHEWHGQGVKKCHGCGVGCVLLHRSVVAQYPFYYSSADELRLSEHDLKKHADVYFYLDLWNDNVPVFVDTNTYVLHNNTDWAKVADA